MEENRETRRKAVGATRSSTTHPRPRVRGTNPRVSAAEVGGEGFYRPLFFQIHTIWHTAIFVNIFQLSQAVSCNAGLVINFVFLKYYFYSINWKS